jgi:tRNA 2-thiouridine synthesizing protein A
MNEPGKASDEVAEDWTSDRVLDTSGLQCPLPVLRARKALISLSAGQRLLVIATDPMAAIDLPHFCAESGHRLLASGPHGGKHRFLIERRSG